MNKMRYILIVLIVITAVIYMIFAQRTHPFKNMDIHLPFRDDDTNTQNDSQPSTEDLSANESYGLPYLENNGKVIASFGEYEQHNETDYEYSEEEADVIAVSSGTVVKSGFASDGSGLYITVEDVNNNFITYKHLASEEHLKKTGTIVNKGEVLTKAGISGNIAPTSGKVMLAIEVKAQSRDGEPVDFEELLKCG